jgi:hypothetical protein
MSEDTVCAVVFLVLLGLAFVSGGLLFHLGRWRSWYLTPDTIFGARPAFYGFVPMGLAFICLVVILLLPTLGARRTVGVYVVVPLGTLAAILAFWHPRCLEPKWVRWLEENNQDILDLIIEEGRKTKDWGKVVATQEGLEAWVAEVRRKHDRPAPVAAPGEVAAKPTPTPRPGRPTRPWPGWPVGLVVIAVSSGLGQYLLGNGLIGFIGGWVVLLIIYLLRPKE